MLLVFKNKDNTEIIGLESMIFGFALDLSDIDLLNVDLLDHSYKHLYSFVSKTFWRRLQDMFSGRLQNISSRRLQDMSSKRLEHIFSVTIFRLPRRLQNIFRDVFKTFWRCLQHVFPRRLRRRNIVTLKTCWRRLQDTSYRRVKTSWRPTNIYWDYSPVKNQLCNHLLELWKSLEYPNTLLNHFLLFAWKGLVHQLQNFSFLFQLLEK